MKTVASALVLALVPGAALAQRVELTPLVGYRAGGSFGITDAVYGAQAQQGLELADHASYGLQLGLQVSRDGELEAIYSRQDTQLRTAGLFTGQPVFGLALETWQLGGNYLFGEEDQRLRPYLGVGLGLTRLLPEPQGLSDETRFSASVAGGVKVFLARHLGLRFEVRGFFTVLESDHQVFCNSPGTCRVAGHSSVISQGEARGGVVLRF